MALQFAETEEEPGDSTPPTAVEEILVLHHSHLDVGYTHSQPILWELQQEFITQAIDWLEQTHDLPCDSRPKWTCEATEPLRRWLAQASPAQIERFRTLHRQGRIGVAALRWHVGAAVDRAGLQRLLDGKEELEQLLGATVRVACQHDVNGVPWPLADVLLDAGVDLFVMAVNPHLGRAVQPRPGMFLWEAPSGRTLRVFNGHQYTMFDQLLHAWDGSVERMAEGWDVLARRLRDLHYPFPFVYLTSTCSPILWDNAPPNPFLPDLIQRWNEAGRGPRVRYATLDDLRERAIAVPENALPILRGDWTDYWSFGYGSAPLATGLNQRAKQLAAAAFVLTGGDESPALRRARDRIDLYDEHTFGYWETADHHPQSQTIELLKQALAHEGYELASFAVMDSLERLTGNAAADNGVKGVILCNPGLYPLTVRPDLPEAWFAEPEPSTEHTYRASRMAYEERSWETGFPRERPRSFGAVELPPRSWKAIPLEQLPEASPTPGLSHHLESEAIERRELNRAVTANHLRRIGQLESPSYRLSYEPHSGRILSLLDRTHDRELLAPRGALDFFAFVRERTDELSDAGRYAFYQRDLEAEKVDSSCWQDWSPVHETPTRLLECEVSESPGRITLQRVLQAPGVRRLVQRISFLAGDPVIHLEAELELEPDPSPQGIYFAFPLALDAGWDALYDTAGQPVLLDQDQLPGACRNWATVESMAAMGDEAGAVALFCPDAPLVQFGDFHFGPPLDAIPRHENPLLLAWPVNNYWDTNFPRVQHGRIRLRYGLMSLDRLDLEVLHEHAHRLLQPALIWPLTGEWQQERAGLLPQSPV
jgi:alpha-mannosidase